eukprot:941112-Pleurochrysis_carterae.AAC.1
MHEHTPLTQSGPQSPLQSCSQCAVILPEEMARGKWYSKGNPTARRIACIDASNQHPSVATTPVASSRVLSLFVRHRLGLAAPHSKAIA